MFTQLQKTAFEIKHSNMIILPQWWTTLQDCGLHPSIIPHDVSTQWNSTYDMLKFVVEYREAIDAITGNQKMKLRQYELDEEDCEIATKLHDALKVSKPIVLYLFLLKKLSVYKDFQRRHSFFLLWYSYTYESLIVAMCS